jgi:hypothetical protein
VVPGEGGKSNSEQHMCRTKHFSLCGGEISVGKSTTGVLLKICLGFDFAVYFYSISRDPKAQNYAAYSNNLTKIVYVQNRKTKL